MWFYGGAGASDRRVATGTERKSFLKVEFPEIVGTTSGNRIHQTDQTGAIVSA